MYWKEQSQATIESSTFLPIPQLRQAAPEDLVTYLMVTAEVGLPDAVNVNVQDLGVDVSLVYCDVQFIAIPVLSSISEERSCTW